MVSLPMFPLCFHLRGINNVPLFPAIVPCAKCQTNYSRDQNVHTCKALPHIGVWKKELHIT
jgi:hypothetical protein